MFRRGEGADTRTCPETFSVLRLAIPQIRPLVARRKMQRLKPAPLRLALRAAQPVAQLFERRRPARNLCQDVRMGCAHVVAGEALGAEQVLGAFVIQANNIQGATHLHGTNGPRARRSRLFSPGAPSVLDVSNQCHRNVLPDRRAPSHDVEQR